MATNIPDDAKQFLESKGIFSLDTKKRTQEVYDWMEEYAANKIEEKDARIKELEDGLKEIIQNVKDRSSMSHANTVENIRAIAQKFLNK